LITTLKSIQFSANKQGTVAPLTWDAINNILRDEGSPHISYDSFNARWEQEGQLPPEQQILHTMVDRFDGNGLVLKTHKKEASPVTGDESQTKSKISQMARHAMK
jgi:hypothetical protein